MYHAMQYILGLTRLVVDLQATSCMKVPFSILLTNEALELGIASTLDCQTSNPRELLWQHFATGKHALSLLV